VDVHRGVRARKMHSSRRDAFHSINQRPIGRVELDGTMEFGIPYRKVSKGRVTANTEMEKDVSLIQYHPGMSPAVLDGILSRSKGAVISGTGLGHVSSELIGTVARAVKDGKPVVMTTQCLSGRVNLNVYDTGRDLMLAGAIPGEDMLPETALVKLMWTLGRTNDMGEVRRTMLSDLRGEISSRREIDE